ncbi:MAG: hypothetical protein WAO02_08970 [Verrucomicrobiia bacterium]
MNRSSRAIRMDSHPWPMRLIAWLTIATQIGLPFNVLLAGGTTTVFAAGATCVMNFCHRILMERRHKPFVSRRATSDPTSGDKFRIELDKQVLDNRCFTGELMLRPARKFKARFGENIRIGKFAGFDLFIRSGFNNTTELVLRGKNSYCTRVTGIALGTIRPLESMVQGIEERTGRLEAEIKDSQKRATELEAKVGAPFEKEERYHHLARRQSEIEDQLDLAKNQAPNQLEAAENTEAMPSPSNLKPLTSNPSNPNEE